jgi:putative aminopeptidase FrvX
VLQVILDAAAKERIAFQRSAVSRATGTDTDAFAYGAAGVPSALISLPLRYMHTTVESVHRKDVEDVIRLIHASLKRIKAGQDWRYHK